MLRPYQEDAIVKVKESLKRGNRKIILSLCTGAGKSVISRKIVEMAKEKNSHVLFVTHRKILIKQMKETLKGLDNVTIGTIQSLYKKDNSHVKIIIIDECHYGSDAAMYAQLPDVIKIGLSATPITRDGYKLDGWQEVIDIVQLCDLIEMGYASPVRVLAPIKPDLKSIKVKAGGYEVQSSFTEMAKPEMIRDIISVYQRHANWLRTLIYCVNIEHAEIMAKAFLDAGYRCDSVHSKKSDSIDALEQFKNGELDILCNVDVLTTGLDLPDICAIIIATPTKSTIKAVQIYGRATRLNQNDPHKVATIIDCAGAINDTIHPLQKMRFDRVKPKNKKELCPCGGKKILIKKYADKPDEDGYFLLTTIHQCDTCKEKFKTEKMELMPLSACECGSNAPKSVEMEQNEKEAIFSLICPDCQTKTEWRKIKLSDAELQEINPPEVVGWDLVRQELRKATNALGKRYHYKWADHVIEMLQSVGADDRYVLSEINRYNANGWKLGGIGYALEKHYARPA